MKTKVSIVKVKGDCPHLGTVPFIKYTRETIEKATELLFKNLGGLDNLIPRNTKRILVKPNLVNASPWHTGITVNLDLVAVVVEAIKNLGFEVVLGEGPGWGTGDSKIIFEKLGLFEFAEKLNVKFYDFKDTEESCRVKIPDGTAMNEVTVHRIVPECDYIVSIAKLKTHCETVMSLSFKNMKGIITTDKQRLAFHLLDVNKCLVDLNRRFKPHLAIVEGFIGLEGIGPVEPGKPKELGLLVAGTDALAVDATCVRIVNYDSKKIWHLKFASEAGLGTLDSNDIEIAGETIENVRCEKFELPLMKIEGLSPYENIHVVDGKPCSQCVAGLASYLYGYIRKDIIDNALKEVKILIGAKAKATGTGNEIALGNCLKRYEGKIPFVGGCPPPSDAYASLVEKLLKSDIK